MGKLIHGGKVYAQVNHGAPEIVNLITTSSSTTAWSSPLSFPSFLVSDYDYLKIEGTSIFEGGSWAINPIFNTNDIPITDSAGNDCASIGGSAFIGKVNDVLYIWTSTGKETTVNKIVGYIGDIPAPTLTALYSFDQSQGGAWINTNVDVSDLDYILFTYSADPAAPDDRLMRQLLKSNIAVYTGGPDVYTTIFTQVEIGAALNVRIYNNILWVSFNGTGPNTKVVTIYNPITF